jgi:hypothetical protein
MFLILVYASLLFTALLSAAACGFHAQLTVDAERDLIGRDLIPAREDRRIRIAHYTALRLDL